MESNNQDYQKDQFITAEQLIGRSLDRGVALGPDPHQTINTYLQKGLLTQLINGTYPATAVDRLVAIDNMLKEGKTLEEIQTFIQKERRSFLQKATDLNTMVSLYKSTTFKSILMLCFMTFLVVFSAAFLSSASTSQGVAGGIARTAAKPVGQTLAAFIKAAKPEDTNSTDPLGLTNISKVITINEKEQIVLEKTMVVESPAAETSTNLNADLLDNADSGTGPGDVLLLDPFGDIVIDGNITTKGVFAGDGSGLSNLPLPSTILYSDQTYANPSWLTSIAWSKLTSRPSLLTSVDGVSNDTGNVDFVAGPGVTITSDDVNNTITFNLAGSGVNADLLDSLDSSQFLRSDTSDSFTSGTLTMAVGTTLDVLGTFTCTNCVGDAAVVNGLTIDATGSVAAAAVTGTLTDSQVADTITASNYLLLAGGTMAGNIDFNTNLALNIGNAGTDFDSSGGLTLAGRETLSALSISSGNRVTNTTTFNPNAGGSQYGYNLTITNSPTVAANTAYGLYVSQSDTTTLANTNYGVYSAVTHTGPTAGTINTHSGYFSATGDTGGASSAYGIYATASGADYNYGLYGYAIGPTSYGVYGAGDAYGLIGYSNNTGVYGSGTSFGVYGTGSTFGTAGSITGPKTSAVYSGYFENLATSSTNSINKYGLYILSTGAWTGIGANNYGLYLADTTGGTNNYTLYLAGTGGTASTGITLGGDTNLYRSAANILATDDDLRVIGNNIQGSGAVSLIDLSTRTLEGGAWSATGNFTVSGLETLSSLSISSGSRVANTTTFNPNAGGSQYGYDLAITNASTVTANTAYGYYASISDTTTTLGNTPIGFGAYVSHTGAVTSAVTISTYGGYFDARKTGASTTGAFNTYGLYGSATGSTEGTSYATGVYGYATGADYTYGVYGSGATYGIFGSGGTYGVYGSGATYGIFGSGATYGVYGLTSGPKTAAAYSGHLINIATSSTASINKYGLYIISTGAWNGAGANNYALYIDDATGGTNNYPIYQAGSSGQNIFLAGTSMFGRVPSGNDASYRAVIQGSLCVDDGTANCPAGPTAGAIYVENSVGAGNVSAFDVSEYYPSVEPTEKGDIVSAAGNSQVKKSTGTYDPGLVGIVSTDPAMVIDETNITFGKTAGDKFNPLKPYVALAGRVPVKVSTENGSIEPGDPLTSSSVPGVAMKATKSGSIIGKALEDYSGSGVGKIMTFVSVGWFVAPLPESSEQTAESSFANIDVETLTAGTVNTQILIVGNRKITMEENGKLKVDGDVQIDGQLIAEKVITDELVVSNQTSGSETVKAGTKELTISTNKVGDKTKILITFTADYSPATRFWVTKNVGESVTIHLDQRTAADANLNWLIVN